MLDIYTRYAEGGSLSEIRDALNQSGVPSPSGRAWTLPSLLKILGFQHQEKYAGHMLFNITRFFKMQKRAKPKERDEWVHCSNAHPAIVPVSILKAVQKRQRKGRA